MNENVRKVFDMLGVEPGDRFMIEGSTSKIIYTIDENLIISDDRKFIYRMLLDYLLRGDYKIIKLPKGPKKKKLRDLTPEEWDKWREKKCRFTRCENCIFNSASCLESESKYSWIHHKDLYSDKFLDQEIEVEE